MHVVLVEILKSFYDIKTKSKLTLLDHLKNTDCVDSILTQNKLKTPVSQPSKISIDDIYCVSRTSFINPCDFDSEIQLKMHSYSWIRITIFSTQFLIKI